MSGEEFSLDKVLAGLENKQVGANAGSILEMLKELNKTLSELQKTVDFFKRIGVLPGIVRGLGKRYDIDVETPLASEMSVAAPTQNHKAVMENISKLSEPQLLELVAALQEHGKKTIESGKPGNKQPDAENS